MNEVLVRWDLKVNWKKSKAMRVARKREECQVRIGDEQLEQVDTTKYLGVMISDDGSMQREVEARVGCASRVIRGLKQAILGKRELSKQTKLKVVNATVMLVLMYGCEAWAVRKEQKLKIQATQMNVQTERSFQYFSLCSLLVVLLKGLHKGQLASTYIMTSISLIVVVNLREN